MEPIKLYPSSTAFMKGQLVYTTYASGCPRKILLSHRGVREEIKGKFKELGADNETRFEATLTGKEYQRELPFKWALPDYNAIVSGRIDYIIDGTIWELKATQSKSSLTSIINGGQLRMENLAQIAVYILAMEKNEAYLQYAYYVGNKYAKQRTFHITIEDSGAICVDKKASGFFVADLLKFLATVADSISNGKILDRPNNWSAMFGSPCGYCPFKSSCDQYDSGVIEGVDAFVSHSASSIKGD